LFCEKACVKQKDKRRNIKAVVLINLICLQGELLFKATQAMR